MTQIPDTIWGEFITWLAKAVAAVVAIWKGIWPALKWWWNRRKRVQRLRQEMADNLSSVMEIQSKQNNKLDTILARQEIMGDELVAQREMKHMHLDISDKMVVVLNQIGELEFANKTFLDFVDKDFGDLQDSNWISSIVHQDDRQAVIEYLQDCVHHKRAFKYEFRLNLNGHGVHEVIFEGRTGEHAGYFINVKQKQ